MNWDVLFKAVSILVAVYQLIKPGARATLKTDLEILNLLKTSSPDRPLEGYDAVRANVERSIRKIYRTEARQKFYRDPDVIKGGLIFLIFSAITLYMLKDGFTYWALVPGFVALTGLLGALGGGKGGRGGSGDAT
jgi:hypothetical protein